MKLTLALLLTMFLATGSYAQAVTYDDFRTVIPFLQKEEFKEAFARTNKILSSTQNDSSDLRGIVTYMNIFSATGMVSLGQMTHDDFTKNANKYIGQYVVMSAHPCVDSSSRAFNSLQFTKNDSGKLQGFTIAANNAKTSILCFEYFDYAAPVNPSDFIGKNVRSGGILKAVETNLNKSTIWVARLRIADAFARVMTPR
ncbi:MAG: hypothetical protein J7621_02230 [Niastella sp.]|nr:hypothetical protein [Niastella sp.]